MQTRLVGLILTLTVSSIVGCGGGSSDKGGSSNAASTSATTVTTANAGEDGGAATTATPPTVASGAPLSTASLITKADGICRKATKKLVAEKSAVKSPNTAVIAAQRATIEQAAVNELSRLSPSASMANDYKALVAARWTLAQNTAKYAKLSSTGGSEGEHQLLMDSATVEHTLATTAGRRGFKACGVIGG